MNGSIGGNGLSEEEEGYRRNRKKILSLVMLAGEIMLSNGAETYRIEETMRRMAESYGLRSIEAFVTPTGIFATIGYSENETSTMVKRVKIRTIHLEKVANVNDLSREMFEGKVGIDCAYKKLLEINKIMPYSRISTALSITISCFCFSYMFGGVWADCFNSAIAAFMLSQFIYFANRRNFSRVLVNLFGGALVSMSALVVINLGIGVNIDMAVIGAIMPLVPGVALTNAIRDILEGDFLSGSTRIVDALIVAICIAAGVGSAYHLWVSIFGGLIL